MTQAFADSIQAKAREYLAAYDTERRFIVERCKHPSVTECALWIIEEGAGHIGSVTEESGETWRASKMCNSVPYAQRTFASLSDALEFAATRKAA